MNPTQTLTANAFYHPIMINYSFGQAVQLNLTPDGHFTITKIDKNGSALGILLDTTVSQITKVYGSSVGMTITAGGRSYLIDFSKRVNIFLAIFLAIFLRSAVLWIVSSTPQAFTDRDVWLNAFKAFGPQGVPVQTDHIGKSILVGVIVGICLIAAGIVTLAVFSTNG